MNPIVMMALLVCGGSAKHVYSKEALECFDHLRARADAVRQKPDLAPATRESANYVVKVLDDMAAEIVKERLKQ